ncbi:hypothetical protein [Pseudomonas sp. VB3]|uniref:hypothetical protein n=1 Tax=Pseudomonas sp. VB3 TaxID=2994641 RepID=UPI0022EC8CA2|nr:hypothetical protein [Pseudomonas sp. VB3]
MTTEKMRDKYEAWASSVLLQEKVTQEFIKGMREGDTYSLTGYSAETSRKYLVGVISGGWMSWQASRAAIEVELPSPHQGNFGWMHQDFAVQKAIEAAGIKWKQGPKRTLSDIIDSMAPKVKP